jgi:ribosomal protein S18 acetylase RimI-like enzyme
MIREAQLTDLESLLELEQLSFEQDRLHRRQLRYLLSKAQGKVLVYESGGSVSGALILAWRRNSSVARIVSVAVHPESRRKKIGSYLVHRAEALARARGLKKMNLEVRLDNEKAVSFYERHGYIRIGLKPDYYADGMTGILFQKLL